ncbi:MscL family protein, partial [Thermoproteota archaeon]
MSEEILKEILSEVKAIKEASIPKPSPPPEVPKGLIAEFQAFLSKYGVIGLAIAVIIGGAAGKLVSSLVADILMPIVTFFIPGGAWRETPWTIGPIVLMVGSFIGNVI